jgi:hypothetical protein
MIAPRQHSVPARTGGDLRFAVQAIAVLLCLSKLGFAWSFLSLEQATFLGYSTSSAARSFVE